MILFESPRGHRLSFSEATLSELRHTAAESDVRVAFARRGMSPDDLPTPPNSRLYGTGQSGELAADAAALPPVMVVSFGTCLTQFADEAIQREAFARGVDAPVAHRWLSTDAIADLSADEADVVVLQLGAQALLEPLFRARTEEEASRLSRGVGKVMAGLVHRARASAPRSMLIVHTVAPPSTWPPALTTDTWASIWASMNSAIKDAAAMHSAVVLDEQALTYRYGASNLFDDLQFPWSHHGGRTDLGREEPNQTAVWHRAIAAELWDCWESAHLPSLKAIVTDLDGVLWPGVLAEGSLEWLDSDSNTSWMHLGIQEALAGLERAGLVLATLSRGDEEVTLGDWAPQARRMRIGPDDFALHSITWETKVTRMERILQQLQTTPDRVLFIDDHPAERAAMRSAFPTMPIVGDDLYDLRRLLLQHPRLRHLSPSPLGSRTASTRAAIAREDIRAQVSEEEFFRHLKVQKTLRAATAQDVPRIVELLERTTQFTLANGERFDSRMLPHTMVMEAVDRYSDYGLIGVSVLDPESSMLTMYAVSCRVIGLDIGADLLRAHAQTLGMARVRVALTATDRNRVLRDALAAFDLRPTPDGLLLNLGGDDVAVDYAPR
ncbi:MULTISPECIES: HAD-IIIC family phosphatase [unclassified Microbacterium]|uniref:HAD-IIIC family phosphatase n=2 Tax=Microbacterium TaxID=33882 RepID=UPI000CFBD774|nr:MULTISPECIES: HAD-IIIC family phosphatase [unclassified Microbacterium]PRB69143.1 hypothetical protein CQ027_17225 [Microbacterium sp. MYb32]PQZ53516.1 hypothetical protein CQ032_15245 [Microbacterium sp. MYb43]PQZ75118.1 hypothetical protein CQ031_14595 [Microbacterium sp. MYb40]PRB19413.1 hypothetical protein CQ040_15895 [Microbacterium sp. MYb54]PRB24614.1 hypothetical protein CQ037_16400 [Microbacterium sp. MYb50]